MRAPLLILISLLATSAAAAEALRLPATEPAQAGKTLPLKKSTGGTAKAGACACFPSDGSWSERRCYKGQYDQRRTCHYACLCNVVCTAWADAGDC